MNTLLTAIVLVALSVKDLKTELEVGYPIETLNEALVLENAKEDSRSTAIEAIQDEITKLEDEAKETIKVNVIADGKSITSLKGIVVGGNEVTASHFAGGKKVFDSLKAKKVIVEVEKEV
ncbi:MAG: hypothetical protein IMY67_12535 [Bacteroidetes bacterium]|nr:hypothetical protein [Bacteroidota bacterium]